MTLKISGSGTKRFFNIARKRRMQLQEIHPFEDGFVFKMRPKDFIKSREIVKKTGVKLKVCEKFGFPFVFLEMKKRILFFIGPPIVLLGLFVMSLFLWGIELQIFGDVAIEPQIIYKELEKAGIKKGMMIKRINTEDLSTKIMSESDQFSWVFAKIDGTRLIISVAGRREKPKFVYSDEPCNIVASKDGIVTNLVVKGGTARVKVGDTVRKGDLLIEGLMEYKDERKETVHALGEVYARTWISEKHPIETSLSESIKTGREFSRYYLRLGDQKIFFGNKSESFLEYDTMEDKMINTIFANKWLFEFGIVKSSERKTIQRLVDVKAATTYARNKAREKVRKKIPPNPISISENMRLVAIDQVVYVEVILEFIEEIALKEPMF